MKPTRILVSILSLILAGLAGGCASVGAFQTAVAVQEEKRTPSADWALHIAILDVGQADAIAMVTSEGKACLIDAGEYSRDAATVARFLRSQGENGVGRIDTVELAFATHYDKDHIGGFAPLIAKGITINKLADQGPSLKRKGATTYTSFLNAVGDPDDTGKAGIRTRAIEGQEWTLGPARIRCVSVRGDTAGTAYDLPLDPSQRHVDENPGSVALLVTIGEFEFYSAGDQTSSDWQSEPDAEIGVVKSGALGRAGPDIDVLKVSHHGSDTSTGAVFVQSLQPEVAVISSTHAKDEIPKMTSIMQLTKNGAVVLITGDGRDPVTGQFPQSTHPVDDGYVPPKELVVNEAGTVHIYVARDGLSYRVRAEGFDRSFSARDSDNKR